MKKILIILLILTVVFFLFNEYYLKNSSCKTEDGSYEIWGSTPIDITEKINKGECECISESLIIENDPNVFSKVQIFEIKKELPNWAIKNVQGFSEKDKTNLVFELNKLSNEEFSKSLKYKYSFLADVVGCLVPVYTFKVKSSNAYFPNYKCVNEAYDSASSESDGFKLLPISEKPNYPIIESETWAGNFGNKGI